MPAAVPWKLWRRRFVWFWTILASASPLGRVDALPTGIAAYQQHSDTLVLRGRVFGRDSTPLQHATVTARYGRYTTSALTDSIGNYEVRIQGVTDTLFITASIFGYRRETRPLQVGSSPLASISANFVLVAVPAVLQTVRTSAPRRPAPVRDPANVFGPNPGADQQAMDLSSPLSGDVRGDINSALALIPGVSVIPGQSISGPTILAFGLPAEQNSTTLNGATTSATRLPRDGLFSSVRLSTYDPKYGSFSGVQVAVTLPSGSSVSERSIRATASTPRLQWPTPIGAQLGTQSRDMIVSGTMSGPGLKSTAYSVAYQFDQRVSSLVSLSTANAEALRAIGISSDSVTRLLEAANSIGLPIGTRTLPTNRSTNRGSIAARYDLTAGSQHPGDPRPVLYILAAGDVSTTSAGAASVRSLPTQLSRLNHSAGHIVLSYSPAAVTWLTQSRISLSTTTDRAAPYVDLPSATVLLTSRLPDGTTQVSPLFLGGGSQGRSRLTTWQLDVNNESSWLTRNGAHRFSVYTSGTFLRSRLLQSPSPGRFMYNSLDDFASGRPSSFARSIAQAQSDAGALQGSFGVSDVFVAGGDQSLGPPAQQGGFVFQYGLRGDGEFLRRVVHPNHILDSVFLTQSAFAPRAMTVAPMLGFDWKGGSYSTRLGPAVFTDWRNSFGGGIREYTGTLTSEIDNGRALASGAPMSSRDLICVGEATPAAEWKSFVTSAMSVPTECLNERVPSNLAQAAFPVRVFSREVKPVRSWRAELHARRVVSTQLVVTAQATWAHNVGQIDPFDLNFSGIRRFALHEEAERPVFVTSSGIDARSGVVSSEESRVSRTYSQVLQLRSDLQSTFRQLIASIEYRLGRSPFSSSLTKTPVVSSTLQLSFIHSVGYGQTRGFVGTTGADPRLKTSAQTQTPRDALQIVANATVSRWFSIALAGRVSAGSNYTPMVDRDINGDGYPNDRAFVFDPTRQLDTSLTQSMNHLLSAAPRNARRCLLAQRSRIAATNACRSEPSASLSTIAIGIDPYRLGLGNRGTFRVLLSNPLGGLDQLLHGPQRIHGWGQLPQPDATLLNVRGFDPVAQRFLYTTNPMFGKPSIEGLRPPFAITLDFRLDVGRDRESQAIEQFLGNEDTQRASGTATELKERMISIAQRFGAADLSTVIALADSLKLSPHQLEGLTRLRDSVTTVRDSIYSELATYLLANSQSSSSRSVRDHWHGAIAAAITASVRAGWDARAILSQEQCAWLIRQRRLVSFEFSAAQLESITRSPILFPR